VLWLESRGAGLLRMFWPAALSAPSELRVGWHPEDALAFDERTGARLQRCEPGWSRDLIRSMQK
jgi:hypothetical protein